MEEIWAQMPKSNLWLLVQAAIAAWAGYNLFRGLRTGEARFRIVGRRDTTPSTYWALIIFWSWMLAGSLAYAGLILFTRR
jgi:hypothetical protein